MEFIRSLKKHLFNTKYLIVLLVFLLLAYNSLFQELYEVTGLSIFFVRTASDISFLQNNLTRHYINVLIITGPLLTMIACSSLYIDDCEANMLGPIFSRIDKNKYHTYNIFTVFILSFLLVFLPLALGYLISLISNPMHLALDNSSGCPTFYIQEYGSNILLQWKAFSPVLFTFFHITITSLFFSIFACLSYIVSMIINWNRYIPIVSVYSIYILYNIVCIHFGHAQMSFFNIINAYSDKISVGSILILLGILFVFTVVLFKITLRVVNKWQN